MKGEPAGGKPGEKGDGHRSLVKPWLGDEKAEIAILGSDLHLYQNGHANAYNNKEILEWLGAG